MRTRRTHLVGIGAVAVLAAGGAACDRVGGAGGPAGPVSDSGYVTAEDGVRLFYRSLGNGPQDVVIPGALYVEEGLGRLAAPGRRLVFYDPRARGRSEAGDRGRITLERQHSDLDAIRRGLEIDRMALIGWSGMGMEMAVYALRNPGRVTRLVQVAPVAARDEPHNAAAYRTRAERVDTVALADVRARRGRGELEGPGEYCRAVWAVTGRASFADPSRMAEVPDVCRFPNEHPDSLALIWPALLGSFAGYDWREAIASLPVPRLVVHGAADAFPLEGSREWVPPGSNARLLVLEDAGHFPWIERPDAFFAAVDAFLDGAWPEAGGG